MLRTGIVRVVGFVASVVTPGPPEIGGWSGDRVVLLQFRSVWRREARLLADRVDADPLSLYLVGAAASVELVDDGSGVWLIVGPQNLRFRGKPVGAGRYELESEEFHGLRVAVL